MTTWGDCCTPSAKDRLMPSTIRRRYLFHGRVQGVGFRYTTVSIAKRHPIVGYVKNLPDGSVELVAEGTASVLDQFLADILSEFAGYVRKYSASDVPADESFTAFEFRQ